MGTPVGTIFGPLEFDGAATDDSTDIANVGASAPPDTQVSNNADLGSSVDRPGIGTAIMADTVGVLWRAASGTVDPWTKAETVDYSSFGVLGSQGQKVIDTAGGDAAFQQGAEQTVTTVLKADNADPSQFWDGVKNSLNNFGSLSTKTLLLVGGVALLVLIAAVAVRK